VVTVPATRHQVQWVASALRQAAAESGVELPLSYSLALVADGLAREPELALTRLGSGVVVHTKPRDEKRLPTVLGYADARGQWYRDGRRHVEMSDSQAPKSQAPASTPEVRL
jgi:hypothetical protein